MKLIRSCVGAAALLLAASPTLAGDAKGQFVVKGGKTSGTIAPTHAAAYVTRDPRDARKTIIELALTDAAIDVDAAIATLQPHTHVINQDVLDDRKPKGGTKITGGQLRGETADLDVEGGMFPSTNALYAARLRLVGGTWLFDSAGMVGMLR